MNTTIARSETVVRSWYLIDAADQTLGRLSTRIATALRGKHKTDFTPHVDCGDYVIVINAEKVAFTGRKLDQKKYYAYSGYTGGLKTRTARQLVTEDPERIIRQAVKGMLPKNRLSRGVIGKLKIYAGAEHPHSAQQPQPFPEYI
ncbi:MAG: 50S ribosomal protein L13 [Oligoflexia bacterium]|nr:50S ribosomal protein L13 [Oligoflexia bacterium]